MLMLVVVDEMAKAIEQKPEAELKARDDCLYLLTHSHKIVIYGIILLVKIRINFEFDP